jgi:hypothetical protein
MIACWLQTLSWLRQLSAGASLHGTTEVEQALLDAQF